MSPMTPKHLERMFRYLDGCCLHQPVWTPVDVDQVLCSVWNGDYDGGWQDCKPPAARYEAWKGSSDSTSYTVVRLKDGRYGLLSESEDYTGHGCQCTSATDIYTSVADLLRYGVEEYQAGARDAIRARLTGLA